MTGPHVIPFLPAYIPVEVCGTVGIDPAQPDAVRKCMDAVQTDVRDDGVSAPAGDVAALRQVVSNARQEGIDLKIVVVPTNPGIDTPLRDIATEVGHANPGSTVLALSPSFAGTYSPAIDRVTLEAGQDVAKTGNPVLSAQNFVGEIRTPDFPWMTLTILLTLGVAAAAVLTRMLQVRSKRSLSPKAAPAASTAADNSLEH
ncbi:Rv1476 family membrane protein [Mycolicibacterium sp. XJ870]